MNRKQAEKIIKLVQKARIGDAFVEIDKHSTQTYTEIEVIRRQYMSGLYNFDIYERLQTAINYVAKTDVKTVEPPIDVFVSSASHDKEDAQQEVKTMHQAGLCVFYSGDDLNPNDTEIYIQKIREVLQKAPAFTLYCTPDAVESERVKKEYETFLKTAQKGNFFVIEGKGYDAERLPPLLKDKKPQQTQEVVKKVQRLIPKPKPEVTITEKIQAFVTKNIKQVYALLGLMAFFTVSYLIWWFIPVPPPQHPPHPDEAKMIGEWIFVGKSLTKTTLVFDTTKVFKREDERGNKKLQGTWRTDGKENRVYVKEDNKEFSLYEIVKIESDKLILKDSLAEYTFIPKRFCKKPHRVEAEYGEGKDGLEKLLEKKCPLPNEVPYLQIYVKETYEKNREKIEYVGNPKGFKIKAGDDLILVCPCNNTSINKK